MNGSPYPLFKDMAENWKGWKGQKKWEDLEGRVSMISECDSLGHVNITVLMLGPNYEDRCQVLIVLEAGQLDDLSKKMMKVFKNAT